MAEVPFVDEEEEEEEEEKEKVPPTPPPDVLPPQKEEKLPPGVYGDKVVLDDGTVVPLKSVMDVLGNIVKGLALPPDIMSKDPATILDYAKAALSKMGTKPPTDPKDEVGWGAYKSALQQVLYVSKADLLHQIGAFPKDSYERKNPWGQSVMSSVRGWAEKVVKGDPLDPAFLADRAIYRSVRDWKTDIKAIDLLSLLHERSQQDIFEVFYEIPKDFLLDPTTFKEVQASLREGKEQALELAKAEFEKAKATQKTDYPLVVKDQWTFTQRDLDRLAQTFLSGTIKEQFLTQPKLTELYKPVQPTREVVPLPPYHKGKPLLPPGVPPPFVEPPEPPPQKKPEEKEPPEWRRLKRKFRIL